MIIVKFNRKKWIADYVTKEVEEQKERLVC